MDNISKESEQLIKYSELTNENSLAIIVLCAAASDNKVTSSERLKFVSLALGNSMFPNDTKLIIEKAAKLLHLINTLGISQSLQIALKSIPEHLKLTAYVWSVDIIIADEILDKAEKVFLDNLKKKLTINNKIAKQIHDVVEIKNRTV